jgi:hypothetical protein
VSELGRQYDLIETVPRALLLPPSGPPAKPE